MHRIGFDSDQYVEMQSRHIAQRRSEFGGKLYLEFGGKLIDDMHASRVLPGFTPDNKVRMLRELADEVEIIVAVNAKDFARRKVRELEGDEGEKHLDEYADGRSERGRCLLRSICEEMGFDSLEYQSLDGMLEAIGIDRKKVCTYCWNGKE